MRWGKMINENKFLKLHEKFESLDLDGLKIIQSPSLYRFTSDAVILANFVKAKPSDKMLELGSGNGVISILVTYKNNLTQTVGIEIQEELADMSYRSVKFNNLDKKITIKNFDMKDLLDKKIFTEKKLNNFDIVVCNPPYKKVCNSKINKNESEKLARHEIKIKFEQICEIANKCLKYGGKFYTCCHCDRMVEIIFKLKQNSLEPKKVLFTQPSKETMPKVVFIEAIKNGKEGVKILPCIITNDKDGKYINEVKKLKFY